MKNNPIIIEKPNDQFTDNDKKMISKILKPLV